MSNQSNQPQPKASELQKQIEQSAHEIWLNNPQTQRFFSNLYQRCIRKALGAAKQAAITKADNAMEHNNLIRVNEIQTIIEKYGTTGIYPYNVEPESNSGETFSPE